MPGTVWRAGQAGKDRAETSVAVLFSRTGGYLPSPTAHAGIAVQIGIARGENHDDVILVSPDHCHIAAVCRTGRRRRC